MISEHTIVQMPVTDRRDRVLQERSDLLSNETPVALVYNGLSHVVLMASDSDLEELAAGFSVTERIVDDFSQIYAIEIADPGPYGRVVSLEIAAEAFMHLKERRRNLTGRTGCGLCGVDSLEAAAPDLKSITVQCRQHNLAAVETALQSFGKDLPIRSQTGSVHAAGLADEHGALLCCFEDVGRHNALDKLIGHCARTGRVMADGIIVISSRASYEMLLKTATAGCSCLVALSAPTAYAVQLAEHAGICLVGFARPERQVIYSHPELLTGL